MNGAVYFKSENAAFSHQRNNTTKQKLSENYKAKLEAEKFVSNERYLQT